MEKSRNKRFISFRLHAVLSIVIKSCPIPPHPARGMNQPFAQCAHAAQLCMYRKKHMLRFSTVCGFRHPLGGLETHLPQVKGEVLEYVMLIKS